MSASGESAGSARRAAEALRERITEGLLEPGCRLVETELATELGVSRNTLREAFRLLTQDGLLSHQPNKGVRVRRLTVEDLADLYRVRRLIECGALRELAELPAGERSFDLAAAREAVAAGEEAARRADWKACGTADIRFHQALAGLAGSPHVDRLMVGVLAELRLAFHAMGDPRRFHEPYLGRNRQLLETLASGDAGKAAQELAFYLEDSRRQLVEAYARVAAAPM
ncbi:GntR family transcriptional regulator [Phaeacidiphilus oryzae]|uniref:GntR family transcriptional regulator n=1 Tax=Phaeacidiphilus oryzae TaxID=348818 RepID=UPI000565F113|nr:GntR family transcriptional regulator [Phaeacidiphilus oryzae]